jgi:hypothetical protein
MGEDKISLVDRSRNAMTLGPAFGIPPHFVG